MAFPGGSGRFVIEISFETPLVAESARLSVSTDSLRYRQLKELTSVNLVLLSTGSERVRPAIDGPEKLTIFSPRDGAVVEGGSVHVRGAGWVDSENAIIVELIDRNDAVLFSTDVFLAPPHGEFYSCLFLSADPGADDGFVGCQGRLREPRFPRCAGGWH
jgi:phosphatidylserine decarboxylase